MSSTLKTILKDTNETLTASALLEGEYGLKDIFIGVPSKIGRSGIKNIIEIDLSEEEKAAFSKSAQTIKSLNALL